VSSGAESKDDGESEDMELMEAVFDLYDVQQNLENIRQDLKQIENNVKKLQNKVKLAQENVKDALSKLVSTITFCDGYRWVYGNYLGVTRICVMHGRGSGWINHLMGCDVSEVSHDCIHSL
jgi:hypothetical protein